MKKVVSFILINTYTAEWIDGNCATVCTQGTENGYYAYSIDKYVQ